MRKFRAIVTYWPLNGYTMFDEDIREGTLCERLSSTFKRRRYWSRRGHGTVMPLDYYVAT